MSISTRLTPFHARIAAHNHANAWFPRGPYTVAAHFGDPAQEALAARFSSVLADVSAMDEMRAEGEGAHLLLSAACGTLVRTMAPGETRLVQWHAEGGALRGFGMLFRETEDAFVLRAEDADIGWFAPHANRFGVGVRDAGAKRGLLFLGGPFAQAVLAAAGLEEASQLEPHLHTRPDWNGMPITVARHARLSGYLIACAAGDAAAVFDKLYAAGLAAGLRLMGQEALELLHLEAGLVLPHLDFSPARESVAAEPRASSLGLSAPSGTHPVLAGIEFDSDTPHPFTPLFHEGKEVGRTLRSAYSLALRRAIALAQLDPKFASPGTLLRIPPLDKPSDENLARVTALPFL